MAKNVRKNLIAILIVCLISTVLILSACDKGEHTHNYGDWFVTSSATCEEAGERTRACIECGHEQTEPIDAIEHDWNDGVVTKDPTCEEAGEKTFTCKNDNNHTRTEGIKAIGHEWDAKQIFKQPTCTEAGLANVECLRCHLTKNNEELKPLGHDWDKGVLVKTATCTKGGEFIKTCQREGCHETNTMTNNPLGHDWDDGILIKTATCTKGGEFKYTCQREGCQGTKTEPTDPVDHIWANNGETVDPTCDKDGSITYSCDFGCNEKKVEILQALGHRWSDWKIITEPKCLTEGLKQHDCTRTDCTKSETQEVAALGHDWSDFIIDKYPSYTEGGLKYKHCLNDGCTETTDVQSIPVLNENAKMDYKITIVDSCKEVYLGTATIEIYKDGSIIEQVDMGTDGVTIVNLYQCHYTVKLKNLSKGYSASQTEYPLYAYDPQLTISLDAQLLEGNYAGVRYKVGSILYNYEFAYYDENGKENNSSFKDILDTKKGILFVFYFSTCSVCKSEMPALVAAANANKDIQVLMVNCGDYDSDYAIRIYQTDYAANSPLWFMKFNDSASLYWPYFNISGTPTAIFVDCNGQVVYRQLGAMNEESFNSNMSRLRERYNKIHSTKNNTNIIKFKAILPRKKSVFN